MIGWVVDRLGVDVVTTASPLGLTLPDVVGLAVRRNPRRAHLLVSRLLGKHLPTDPRLVDGAGLVLGELVRDALAGTPSAGPDGPGSASPRARLLTEALADPTGPATAALGALPRRPDAATPALVVGFAETATALGQCVADALGAPALHSTRRRVPGVRPVGAFEEEHSHATTHLLLPADPGWLSAPVPLVLVDDELSTGRTVLNTVTALHRLAPRDRYVVATLLDVRTAEDRRRTAEHAAALGTRIDVVALVAGEVVLPPDVAARAARTVAAADAAAPTAEDRGAAARGPAAGRGAARRVDLGWPSDLPETGRHGTTPADGDALDRWLVPDRLRAALLPGQGRRDDPGDRDVLVLGAEELMYLPLRLAAALAVGGRTRVRYSTTTRSPVLAVPDPGYAIRSALTFPAHDDPADGPGPRFTYNLGDSWDTVVVVVDASGETPELSAPGGLLDALGGVARDVVLVVLPDAAAERARDARAATGAATPAGAGATA